MQKVLHIDGSADCFALVSTLLSGIASVTWAKTVEEGERFLNEIQFDMILLDVAEPDGSGFNLGALLQAHEKFHTIPVIFLSTIVDTASKVLAFQMGAIDYIVKPFDNMELRARIQSRLVRFEKFKTLYGSKAFEDVIKIGSLEIDRTLQRVTLNGVHIDLTSLEFKTLLVLTKDLNSVVSRNEIMLQVWHDQNVNERAVDTHISKLRKKLGSKVIQSVHGAGYRVNAA